MSRVRLLLVGVLLFGAMEGLSTVPVSSLSFNITSGTFSCDGNVICKVNASTHNSLGTLSLTPLGDPYNINSTDWLYKGTYGVALHKDPLQLLDSFTHQRASFSTSFSFRIQAQVTSYNETTRVTYYRPGDGMAFVMFANASWVGGDGAVLGAYTLKTGRQGTVTVAVEFDTFQNTWDIDNNHVGIDLETIQSVVARSAHELNPNMSLSYAPGPLFAWIDYDAKESLLEVRFDSKSIKPVIPFLTLEVDLPSYFGQEQAWVGFTASNGKYYNFYSVYNWSFDSYFTPSAEAAPAPMVEGLTPTKASTSSKVALLAIAISGGLLLFIVLGLLACCLCARNRKKYCDGDGAGARAGHLRAVKGSGSQRSFTSSMNLAELPGSLKNFSFKELSVATNGFSEQSKLGEGGFGNVYRGVLRNGKLIAVKKVNHDSKQGEKEFLAEVWIISQLRHRNIVQLLGWCNDNSKFLLAYEYMPNASLDKVLFSPSTGFLLSWSKRFKIATGIAAALHYLHEGWRQQVIHRDVKSSNIMLDENFTALLGDFGLARLVDHQQNPETTLIAGTYGYIAPETPITGKFTVKSDVYAFGAVALELACGRKAYDPSLQVPSMILVDLVWSRLYEGSLLSVADPRLGGDYDERQMEVLLLLGLLCSHPNPDERPAIRQVEDILAEDVEMPPVPKSKPAAIYASDMPVYRIDAQRRASIIPSLSGSLKGSHSVLSTDSCDSMKMTTTTSSLSTDSYTGTFNSLNFPGASSDPSRKSN